MNTNANTTAAEFPSYFDGDATTNITLSLFSAILRIFSLGFASPAVLCLKKRWQICHTVVSGRRLIFDGNPAELLVKNAAWVLISIVTFGIFLPFKALKLMKWEISHTHFTGYQNDGRNKSQFTGRWYAYIGVHTATFFVTVLTLGIAYSWAYNFKWKWLTNHKIIDGFATRYDATGKIFAVKQVKWAFLTIITLGIFILLLKGRLLRYNTSHTRVDNPLAIPLDYELADNQTSVCVANKYALLSFIFSLPSALFTFSALLTAHLGALIGKSAIAVVPYAILTGATAMIATAIVLGVKGFKTARTLDGNGRILSIITIIANCCIAVCGIGALITLLLSV